MLRKIKSFFANFISAKALWLAPVLYICLTKIAFAGDEPPASISLYDMVRNPFDAILSIFSLILYVISNYILSPILSFVSGTLFNWALNLVITANTAKIVLPAWTYTLSFANNLFILILLAIAVGTILGLGDFNYKKILPKFFMVILLINFSLTIGLVIIDTTNALSKFFVNVIQSDGTSLTAQVMQSLNATVILEQTNSAVTGEINASKATETAIKAAADKKAADAAAAAKIAENKATNPTGFQETYLMAEGYNAGVEVDTKDLTASRSLSDKPITISALNVFFKFIMIIIFQLILIGTFLFGAIYMITRTFWLWLLLMVAPLAWIAHLLPNTEEYWKKWWGLFIQWAFFAPTYLFMVSIAIGIASKTFAKSGTMGNLATYSGFSAAQVIQMLCVAFLMMAGIHLGKETGGATANGIMNYGKGLGSRYGKALKNLRSKGFIEKTLEKIGPEGAARFTAGLISKVPGAGKIAGFTQEKIQMEKQKEGMKKLKEEAEAFMQVSIDDLIKDIEKDVKTKKITKITAAKAFAFQQRSKDEYGSLDEDSNKSLRNLVNSQIGGLPSPGTISFTKKQDPNKNLTDAIDKLAAKI